MKTINVAWLLSKRQKCHVSEERWHRAAPRIHSRPPSRTSKVTVRREEMPACLLEALLLHIYDWIWGKTHSSNATTKKKKLKAPPFWMWGPVWRLQGCTVMEKKKNRHAAVLSFVVQRIKPTVQQSGCSPLLYNVNNSRKTLVPPIWPEVHERTEREREVTELQREWARAVFWHCAISWSDGYTWHIHVHHRPSHRDSFSRTLQMVRRSFNF